MVDLKRFLISLVISVSPLLGISKCVASELEVMENARANFTKGNFAKAIELYSTVPASSDFWLDAIEERAWSHTRMANYESALADLHSVTSTVWSSQVGPETYMLSTFVSLKICAYKDVVTKIDLFKKRMYPRIDALENMMARPLPSDFWNMSEAIKNGKVTMASLGKNAEKYPRYFFRDRKVADALRSNSVAVVNSRMKELAKQDLKEIEANLKKMKIIEVELIQKILLTEQSKNSKKDLNFSSIDRNKSMVFPVTDEEVWIDEVGHFQVKADLCQALAGKNL
jgi:hypothetical protein